jgi:predicted molibdopterin-dependent oxidoreductase YjgC
MSAGRFVRLAETERRIVNFFVDDVATEALEGDTLLIAILASRKQVRRSEFGDGNRAGFCLMGSCQDCWVSTESGERIKACSTNVAAGMRVCTTELQLKWAGKE